MAELSARRGPGGPLLGGQSLQLSAAAQPRQRHSTGEHFAAPLCVFSGSGVVARVLRLRAIRCLGLRAKTSLAHFMSSVQRHAIPAVRSPALLIYACSLFLAFASRIA